MVAKMKCPVCSSSNVKFKNPKQYLYENSGLSDVILVGGVEQTDCSDCGHTTTLVQGEQQLLQLLGFMIVTGSPGIKGEELRFLRSLMGLSQSELADRMQMPRRETISDWERKERVFKTPAEEMVLKLVLVNLFNEQILEAAYCFLTEDHREEMNVFMTQFVAQIGEMLAAPKVTRKLELKRRPRLNIWENNLSLAM